MKRIVVLLFVVLVACGGKKGPRDIGNRSPRSELVEGGGPATAADAGADAAHVIAKPDVAGKPARVLAHASSRAIATNATNVFYGDAEDDRLYTVPKTGAAEPARLAPRAPLKGALSVDGSTLVWIVATGDAVVRAPVAGGTPTTVRDRGIFTDVIAGKGDIFFTETEGRGGSVSRISGATAARLASFSGSPRGLALDATHVYVATATKLVAVPRLRNEPRELAASVAFAHPQVDETHVYATTTVDGAPALVRVAKTGGSLEIVVRDIHPGAPIALHRGLLAWFHPTRPALMGMKIGSNDVRVLSEHHAFHEPAALVLDNDGAFIAAGDGADAMILGVPY